MSYTYIAYISINDANGRSLNLTGTPTITVWNGRTKSSIATPSPTLTNITTGLYAVEIEIATKTDVLFKIVPHVDDQADVHDIKVIHEGYIETVEEIYADMAEVDDLLTPILAIQAKTDELTFTTPNRVDASADVDAQAVADAIEPLIPTPANIWEYVEGGGRTLTQSATSVISAVTGSAITQVRGDTWDITLTGLTLDDNLIQFAIKRKQTDADKHALVFIDNKTGLLVLNGAPAEAGDGSLLYAGTSLRIRMKAPRTAQLPTDKFKYGIQSIAVDGTVLEPYAGDFILLADTVRTASGGE
jgi:hypothetical protein